MEQRQLARNSSSLWQLLRHSSSLRCNNSLWCTPAAYGATTAGEALQQLMVQWQLVRHSSSLRCNDSLWCTSEANGATQLLRHSSSLRCNDSWWGTPAAYGAMTACDALQQPMVQQQLVRHSSSPMEQRQLVRHSSSLRCNDSLWGNPWALYVGKFYFIHLVFLNDKMQLDFLPECCRVEKTKLEL